MTDISVDAPAPPGQDRVIASWEHGIRLVDCGAGHAAITMPIQGTRKEVARLNYGSYAATSTVHWNDTGQGALEEFKRNWIDTKVYARIADWLQGPR